MCASPLSEKIKLNTDFRTTFSNLFPKWERESNLIANDDIAEFCDVMVEEESFLRHLNVSVNRFTDEGLEMLCKALKYKN